MPVEAQLTLESIGLKRGWLILWSRDRHHRVRGDFFSIAGRIQPGVRLQIRGEQWIVIQKDRSSTGDWSIRCVGVSGIVKTREARFLLSLEESLKVLDTGPAPGEQAALFGMSSAESEE